MCFCECVSEYVSMNGLSRICFQFGLSCKFLPWLLSVKSRSRARNNSSSDVFINVSKTAYENPAKTLNDIDGESFPVSKFDFKSFPSADLKFPQKIFTLTFSV